MRGLLLAAVGLCGFSAAAAGPVVLTTYESIEGVWRLNHVRSDDPQGHVSPRESRDDNRPRRGGRPGGDGPGGPRGGRGGFSGPNRPDPEEMIRMRGAMQELLVAPNRMTVVCLDGDLLFTYDDGRVMRLIPDDAPHAGIVADGIKVMRKTKWEDDSLTVQFELPSGMSVLQTHRVQPDSGQLIVTTSLQGGRGTGEREFHRVYDAEEP